MNVYRSLFSKRVLFLFILGALSSCENVQTQKMSENSYFDLNGLLQKQIILLDSLRPEVHKITVIDGVEEAQETKFDSTDWLREMEIFFEVDINEPILRDAYTLEEKNIGDSIRLLSYQALDKENLEIEFLNVYYTKEGELPSQISAVFTEKNALYDSKRSLQLDFDNIGGLHLLRGYNIQGIQKMLLKDTIFYEVKVSNTFDSQ